MSTFPSNVRLGMTEMTRFILDNQFVRLAGEPGCFKVQCGAGMGLCCAGDLADLAFYKMVEQTWVQSHTTCDDFQIICYFRFRDDGIYILNCPRSKRLEFAHSLTCFKVQYEASGFDSITMLDVEFFRGHQWHSTGVLDHRLFRKETSQWSPLLPSSFQNPVIHRSVLKAQLERIQRKHSKSAAAARDVKCFQSNNLACTGLSVNLLSSPPCKKLKVLLPASFCPSGPNGRQYHSQASPCEAGTRLE